MLIQFTVENFLSIREKIFLNLEPSADKMHEENIITKGKKAALNTLLVYGANASGKSSLYKAMSTAIEMIRNSNNVQVTEYLPIIPFKLDAYSKNKPSSFEFTFIAKDNYKYIYGFSASQKEVTEEYLYCYYTAKPTLLFEVKKGVIPKYNREYKSKFEAAYKMNTANKLLLATATSWNVECTKTAFEWFAETAETYTETLGLGKYSLEKYNDEDKNDYILFATDLLKKSDININSISVEANEISNNKKYILSQNYNEMGFYDIRTGHTVVNEQGKKEEYSLSLQEESLGTQQLFYYAPILKDTFEKGKMLFIDEIECSLHPLLVKCITNMFRDRDINKQGAQLICTTHETSILSLNAFRRDQIYFTEKSDKTGVTDLYSLDEFSVRKTENIENGYLQGRYGAIPYLMAEEVW